MKTAALLFSQQQCFFIVIAAAFACLHPVASNPTSPRCNLSSLPNSVVITSSSGSYELRYGYDRAASVLALGINASFYDGNPGWIGFGLRIDVGSNYTTMGPSDLFQAFAIHDNLLPTTCFVESGLILSDNDEPILGRRVGREWDIYGQSLIFSPQNASLVAFLQISPLDVSEDISEIEILAALGTQSQLGAQGPACNSTLVHNVLAARAMIPFQGIEYVLPAVGLCFYGEPSSLDGSGCDECFQGWVGEFCNVSCPCIHGQCLNALNNTGVCSICTSGYYGPTCNRECECIEGRGACSDGIDGDGFCSCFEGFGGLYCENCDAIHFGQNCTEQCLCQSGICNSGEIGDGMCLSCAKNYAGSFCNISCPALCPNGTTCDVGIQGSGTCVGPSTTSEAQTTLEDDTTAPYSTLDNTTTPPPTTSPTFVLYLEVTLDMELSTFNQTVFIEIVSSALNVAPTDIRIYDVLPGSVIVVFEFVNMGLATMQQKYDEFKYLAQQVNSSLDDLNILSVHAVKGTLPTGVVITPAPQPPTTTTTTTKPTTTTTQLPTTTVPPLPQQEKGKLSQQAIIGIGIGVAVVFVGALAAIYCVCCGQASESAEEGSEQGATSPPKFASGDERTSPRKDTWADEDEPRPYTDTYEMSATLAPPIVVSSNPTDGVNNDDDKPLPTAAERMRELLDEEPLSLRTDHQRPADFTPPAEPAPALTLAMPTNEPLTPGRAGAPKVSPRSPQSILDEIEKAKSDTLRKDDFLERMKHHLAAEAHSPRTETAIESPKHEAARTPPPPPLPPFPQEQPFEPGIPSPER